MSYTVLVYSHPGAVNPRDRWAVARYNDKPVARFYVPSGDWSKRWSQPLLERDGGRGIGESYRFSHTFLVSDLHPDNSLKVTEELAKDSLDLKRRVEVLSGTNADLRTQVRMLTEQREADKAEFMRRVKEQESYYLRQIKRLADGRESVAKELREQRKLNHGQRTVIDDLYEQSRTPGELRAELNKYKQAKAKWKRIAGENGYFRDRFFELVDGLGNDAEMLRKRAETDLKHLARTVELCDELRKARK